MAAARIPLSQSDFISKMISAGVAPGTAKFVRQELDDFYFDPLKPDPGDRWEGTLRIDPEDLEDLTAKFWKQQGWEQPREPVVLPSDPTLLEYALWLDRQRQFQK